MRSIDLLMLAVLASITTASSVLAAFAYQRGPSSVVATFDYAYLPFSIGWGFLFFAETINGPILAGICMIAAAGWMAVHRTIAIRRRSRGLQKIS